MVLQCFEDVPLMNTRSLELPFYRANLRVRARAMNCKPETTQLEIVNKHVKR